MAIDLVNKPSRGPDPIPGMSPVTPKTPSRPSWNDVSSRFGEVGYVKLDPADVFQAGSQGYNAVHAGHQGYDAVHAGHQGYDAAQAGHQGYTAQHATSRGYDALTGDVERMNATTREVTPQETAQHQLAGIIDANSPLLQRARSRALESMGSRGLINSSMALGAADAALYDTALPIAQFDAGQYSLAARDNQSFLNNASQFNAQQANSMTAFNVGEQNTARRFEADAANVTSRFNTEATNRASEFTADAANRAAQFNTAQINDARRFTADAANSAMQFNARETNSARAFSANAANSAAQFNAGETNRASAFGADAANRAAIANADARNRALDLNARLGSQAMADSARLSADIAMRQIESSDRMSLEGQRIAAGMVNNLQSSIDMIMRDPNMTEEQKRAAIENILAVSRGGLDLAGSLTGDEFGSMLDFSVDDFAMGSDFQPPPGPATGGTPPPGRGPFNDSRSNEGGMY